MTLQAEVQAILDRGVSAGDVVGAAAQVVTGDGLLAAAAAGNRSAATTEPDALPMTLDTVCWIASMTKAVTGTAAMQLVERGELHLDEPASSVLPSLADAGVIEGFDRDGQPVVRPARGQISLRHLLTHTAGFGYPYWSEPLLRYHQATGTDSITSGELVATTTVPALFDPGERWMYGINIDYVGRIVEEVSGQRLDDYFDEHILGPLGMDSTAFSLSDEMESRLSVVHVRLPDGSLAARDLPRSPEPRFPSGGGGLYSTARDYCRFLQMILGWGSRNDVRVLRETTVEAMTANHIGGLRVVALPSAMPELTNDAEFFPGVQKSWGLTFQINEEPLPTGRPAGGLMWAGIANSFFWVDMDNQVAGAYMSQQLPFADARTYQLYIDIETAAYSRI